MHETGKLLIAKWGFDAAEHEKYIEKIIGRFQNKYISDAISRVARTPLRKLGNHERFIRPMVELTQIDEMPFHLLETIGMVFNYFDPEDEQCQELKEMILQKGLDKIITEVTGIDNQKILGSIKQNVEKYAYKVA